MTARSRHLGWTLAAALALAPLAGCEDDTVPAGNPDASVAAGDAGAPAVDAGAAAPDRAAGAEASAVAGDASAGAADRSGADAAPGTTDAAPATLDASPARADAAPVGSPAGLAVVSSDFKSAAVSLVDPTTGMVTKDGCLSSASKAPQLSAALSGDVVLPSRPQPGNPLLVIDRKQSVLTWVDPKSCAVLRQLNVGGGFNANPYDVVAVGPTKAYVLRYDANKAKPEEGSDLLVIDPEKGTMGPTIDLRPHVGEAPTGKTLLPRPSAGVLLGGKVHVVLNKQDAAFGAAGPGRVVIVDPATDKVTGAIDLPTLRNCGSIAPLGATGLAVSCGGAFSDGPKQIDGSGIAWIDLSASPPVIKKVVEAKAFGRPVSFDTVTVLDESVAFTVTAGAFMGGPKDALWAFDWKGGAPRKAFESTESFVLQAFVDTAGRRLFVAEATDKSPKVHVFKIDAGGATTASGTFVSNPSTGLPPRHLAWY
jgi:hypothetical protein